jgi:hypothetical protein
MRNCRAYCVWTDPRTPLIPALAGIQRQNPGGFCEPWVPAFAGTSGPSNVRSFGMCARWIAGAILLLGALGAAQAADTLAVDIINASEPTLCAEKDNVYLKLQSGDVRRFTIEAAHPAYVGTIVHDRWAPDFAHCDMSNDPAFKFEKRRVTIYETEEWQLVGLTFPSFWRGNQVPVRVGNRTETGFHLLQLWTRYQERAEEVLVLYPADGYWRARPLPPQNLRWSAYGSSFLIGPVETAGRPFVDISDVAFDPATRTFTLNFERGGSATLRLDTLDQERIVLDVELLQPIAGGPFAALRSMFVRDGNADVARVGWRTKGSAEWLQMPVMNFSRASAAELWAGRLLPSRHNTSAPDMVFRNFSGAAR